MKYIDLTEKALSESNHQYKIIEQQYYIDDNGNKYDVDGKYVVLKPTHREKEVANLLGKLYGGEIKIIPRINMPEKIKTPDYEINGNKYDLKQISGNGKNTLDNAIVKQKRQAPNFIFDISNSKLNEIEAITQINNIYNSIHREWINEIILIKNNDIIKIFKRK